MAWTMTSKRVPGGIEVCIGAIKVASIRFTPRNQAALWLMVPDGEVSTFACSSVTAALQLMHEKLNSPPPEGFQLPQFKRTP